MNDITIGILGGMGAKATAPFVELVVEQCQALYGATQDDEYPHIMIYSLPTPMYLDRPLDHERVSATIIAGLQRLERTGVDFIAMPCNTAHQYYEQLQASIGVRLLHIAEETLQVMPDNIRTISLLATRFTVDAQIYSPGFNAAGLNFEHSEAWQCAVDEVLVGLKDNVSLDKLKAVWAALLEDIKSAGVDAAVIGCTDLNAVSRYVTPPITMVDATEALARATVQRYLDLAKVTA